MGSEERVVCPENAPLVEYMRKWWTKMAEEKPKNYTPNTESNIKKGFTNLCKHKTPVTTLKEFKAIKGVGKWILSELREFFDTNAARPSEGNDMAKGGKKTKGSGSYLPKKNSVPYALLITLYRETGPGTETIDKKTLIAAAEASGLSNGPIRPERGSGKASKPGAPVSSAKEWYSGWSGMKTLIDKCLVCRSNCPAKYKLSEKGRQVAIECLSKSGMLVSAQNLVRSKDAQNVENLEPDSSDACTSSDSDTKKDKEHAIPAECLERFTILGYKREQVAHALAEVSPCSLSQDISTLWPKVLCQLRENEVYDSHPDPQANVRRNSCDVSTSCRRDAVGQKNLTTGGINQNGFTSLNLGASLEKSVSPVISYPSLECHVKEVRESVCQASEDGLKLPPLENLEKFEDAYKVVLKLDNREQFVRSDSPLLAKICANFEIEIEVDCLPVGDAIWVARHKHLCIDYVLDFIAERKNVDDLRSSIKDTRYKDQKLRLQKTGLKKIMYVVEGDANACDGADCIKTACFTTEILDGFDLQRTNGLSDTLRRYGFLTLAIIDYYKMNSCPDKCKSAGTCITYAEFTKKCRDLGKMTVSDVFATQLMQVPQVTEKVAKAVLKCYPTLHSLAVAYAALDDDIVAQEKLLMNKSGGDVGAAASRSIYRFVWG